RIVEPDDDLDGDEHEPRQRRLGGPVPDGAAAHEMLRGTQRQFGHASTLAHRRTHPQMPNVMLCAVLILLPPSQSKATPRSGRCPELGSLSLPELTPAREKVLDALVDLCANRADAADLLALSPGLAGEVARNAALRTAPTLPVGRLYTGVLYDALDLASL